MKDFLKPPYSSNGRRPYIVAKCGMERYITAGMLDKSGGCFDWPAISIEEANAIRDYIVLACNSHDDLLAACEAVRIELKYFRKFAIRDEESEAILAIDKRIAQINAAIAKATGE